MPRPLDRAASILVAVHGLLLAGCGAPERPDVLVVTVDTLRPDALGWVAGRNATPAFDRLAAGGVAFAHAVAPVPLTLPSHTAMFTGLLPRTSGVRENGDVVPDDLALLQERFARAGYRTGAVVSGFPLRRQSGLDRGFSSYDDTLPLDRVGDWAARPADEAVRAALQFLDASPPGAPPWYLWLHFYDPHEPYDPPSRLAGDGSGRSRYDGEVRFVDESLERLDRELSRRFADRRRLTIFAADHGESLGEHDEEAHGFFVYDATLGVPLVVALPGAVRPARSDLPARLIDVAPTVLDLCGLEPLDPVDGESLRPLLEARTESWKAAYVESWEPYLGYGWAPLRGLRTATAKYIEAPRPELYHLADDPGELSDLSTTRPDEMRELRAALAEFERRPARPRFNAAEEPEESGRALAALGYLGRSAEIPAELDRGLADPKDRSATRRALLAAERQAGAGDLAGALAAFDAVLAGEGDNRYALLRGGALERRLGRPAEAAARLGRLAALDPLQPEAHYELGSACVESGRFDCAIAAFERVVELQPRRAIAWSNLSFARFQLGDRAGALAAGRRAAELDPSSALLAANLRDLEAASQR